MKRFIPVIVLSWFILISPGQALSAGPYVSGNIGLSLLTDSDTSIPGAFNSEVSADPGFSIGGALGYDFGTFRFEGEIAYRNNDVDDANVVGFGTVTLTGDVQSVSFMANGYYDFHSGTSPFIPYLGLGIGFSNITSDITAPALTPFALVDDSAIVFAYQFMAGIGYQINPNTVFTLDYRYFSTTDPEFDPGPGFIAGLPDVESEYQSHILNVGIRYSF